MSPAIFGTDGIRAPFGKYPLDRPGVLAVATALGEALRGLGGEPCVILGGDTRNSTPTICRWLAAALHTQGVRCRFAGVVPTPGIAWLVVNSGASAGIAVSASHNPDPDNGIKLIGPNGRKWSPQDERRLEKRIGELEVSSIDESPLLLDAELAVRYCDFLATVLPQNALAGLRLVLDTAYGAASELAAPLFRTYGAEVTVLHDTPDGRNINRDAGSTAPRQLVAAVVEQGAGLGIAFDGDADRSLLVDERGELRDGDAMLYLWATAMQAQGELSPPAIVATSMSNLGLERALQQQGIDVVRCDVGDRAVVDAMLEHGISLGGEQSGHLVCSRFSTTGDGLLTALQMAYLVARSGRPLSELLAPFVRFPQVLLNVPVARKPALESLPQLTAARHRVERELSGHGRLVLRYSGTEPLARVMIEGPELTMIERQAAALAAALALDLG